jgi:hypothetical protein
MVVRFGDDDVLRYKDARVSLRGIPLRQQNRRVEPYRWHIFTHGVEDIVVLDPPREPFSAPMTPINQILAAGPQQSQRRTLIHGVVTFADDYLVIQNGEFGISIHPREKITAAVGDVVDVAGFAKLGMFNPVLEEALIRVVGQEALPPAEVLDLQTVNGRELAERDWRRVTLSGTVIDVMMQRGNRIGFNMHVGNKTIPVRLAKEVDLPDGIVRDMKMQVTGVCDLAPGEGVLLLSNHPTSFTLLVAQRQDLVLLQAPSWWTRERLGYMAAMVGIALFIAMIWALSLRYRVELR